MTRRNYAIPMAALVVGALVCVRQSAYSNEAQLAREIVDATGAKGGLVVHLGCGDGSLTAALRVNDRFVVHGLDADPAKVAAARAHIQKLGTYGAVSVDRWSGGRLPYAENMVNLLVAEQPPNVPLSEIMRVLVPYGVAYIKTTGEWTKTVKPWPAELDEWTHFFHDASGNAVARDTVVGPPKRMKWICEPLWCRGHEIVSSLSAMVSAHGRVFYVLDEGPTGIYSLPEKWMLVARDAFNGVLLWKRECERRRVGPRQLVADGERLYAVLSADGCVSVLDAATGETTRTLTEIPNTDEILCGDGLLVLVSRTDERRGAAPRVVALRAETLEQAWEALAAGVVPLMTAMASGRVVFFNREAVVCLDAKTGAERWRTKIPQGQPDAAAAGGAGALVVTDKMVYCWAGNRLDGLSAETGEILWTDTKAKTGRPGLFLASGMLWEGLGPTRGRDPLTGEVKRTIDPGLVFSRGHHPRCYRSKATERYLITPNRGAEFLSLTSDNHVKNDWVRGPCGYGVMPCNGLLYAPPHQCFCYGGVMLTGFKVLSPASEAVAPEPAELRLERGPAYEDARNAQVGAQKADDWPTYRHDPERLGSTSSAVPADLACLWRVELGGKLTPPVVADGRLYAASVDAHTVYALNAQNGQRLWSFTAGGRVDSPPTIYGGLVLFGCADGWVYCLRATDGELAWRFRAAPAERLIGAFGQLESAWRVHGSVLVKDGLAYCTAGRSTYLDGGIWVCALDPRTGHMVHEVHLEGPEPDLTKENPEYLPAFQIEGARSDILVTDGTYIYLYQVKLDAKLVPQPVPYVAADEQTTPSMDLSEAGYLDTEIFRKGLENRTDFEAFTKLGVLRGPLGDRKLGLHLFSTGGFLDDSWFNRTYWMYSATWPGYYIAHLAPKTGQLLVVDSTTTYGVQAFTSRNIHSPTFTPGKQGYLVFADRNDNEPIVDPRSRNRDKGMGYTRTAPPKWYVWAPIRVRGMVVAGKTLFIAGPPDVVDRDDPLAALQGRKGAVLWALSAADGKKLAEHVLDSEPVFDGLIAAGGQLYACCRNGEVACFGGR